MSVEENKALIRRLNDEVFNTGNVALMHELMAEDYVAHSPPVAEGIGGTTQGLQAVEQEMAFFRTVFSDVHIVIEDMLGEGDKVAVRGFTRGRHTGEIYGVRPSGNQVTLSWSAIYRIANGKIAERWLNSDDLNSYQQLGLIPPQQQRTG